MTNQQKREIVKNDYDNIAEMYVKNCSEFEFYKPFVDNFIRSLSGKKILDVGCGHGVFTNYFYQKGLIAVGVDFSKNLLKVAKENYPNITFIEKDICDFTTKVKYNGIFIKNVLFHLPDDDLKRVLNNLEEYLEQNGKICILLEIPREAGEQIVTEEFDENLKVYYNYLMPEKVVNLLENANFSVDNVEIIKNNENATIYAYGLMVINATKKKGK